MEKRLIEMLAKIAETAPRRFTLLSEYPDWEEITNYAKENFSHWQGVVVDGQFRLGKLYFLLLLYKHYNRTHLPGDEFVKVPFHCYEIAPGDVVFTTSQIQYDMEQDKYVGVEAETIRQMSYKLRGIEPPAPTETAQPPKRSGCMSIIAIIVIIGLFIALC